MSKPVVKTNIKPRRRIKDLYAKPQLVRFGQDGAALYEVVRNRSTGEETHTLRRVYDLDGNDHDPAELAWADSEDDILVIITAPSPLQREQAMREAQSFRARKMLKARREEDSDEHLNGIAFVTDMGMDTLVEYVLTVDDGKRRDEAQREVLSRDEWKDFTALQDSIRAWDEAGRPDTDEWVDVIAKDVEFGRQVGQESDRLREIARESLHLLPREALESRGLEKRTELLGNQAFMAQYEREMLFAACRDPEDMRSPYFDSIDDMMDESEYVHDVLAGVYANFLTEEREVKNSSGAAPGSQSLELPDAPETSEASTPTDATE